MRATLLTALSLVEVDGHPLAAEEPQLAAEQVELAEDRLESRRVVLAEIGDGLEVGLELPQQPEQLFDCARTHSSRRRLERPLFR